MVPVVEDIIKSDQSGFMSYLPSFGTVFTTTCIVVIGGVILYYVVGGIVTSIIENEDLLQKQASALRVEELASATPEIPLRNPGLSKILSDPQVIDTMQKVSETLSDKIT